MIIYRFHYSCTNTPNVATIIAVVRTTFLTFQQLLPTMITVAVEGSRT